MWRSLVVYLEFKCYNVLQNCKKSNNFITCIKTACMQYQSEPPNKMDLCKTQKYQYFFPPLVQRRYVIQTFVISCNKVTLESAVGWFVKFCAPSWRFHRQTLEGLCHCGVTVLSFGSQQNMYTAKVTQHNLMSICGLPSVSLWRQTVTFTSQVCNLGKKSDVHLPSKSVLTGIKRELQAYIDKSQSNSEVTWVTNKYLKCLVSKMSP